MNKNIYFDMDGTIADLYGVEGWLDDLMRESAEPYLVARPLVNMSRLARYLNKLTRRGYTVNIISWTSKGGSENFNKAVTFAKIWWLKEHLPSVNWTKINIIPYGTPKESYGTGILFDDEKRNRDAWGKGAHDETEIFTILKELTAA